MDLTKLKEAIGILNECLSEYTDEESKEGEPLDRPTTEKDMAEEEMGEDAEGHEAPMEEGKKKFGFKGAMKQKKTGMF